MSSALRHNLRGPGWRWRAVLAAVLAAAAPLANAAVSCTATAIPVAFGTYDALSATPRSAAGRITLRCTASGVAERVAATLTIGSGLGGSSAVRRMVSGANTLDYNLFTSAAYSQIWGDGTAGTRFVALTLNVPAGATRNANRTVYGRIPALQNPAAGSFADTIVVTVIY